MATGATLTALRAGDRVTLAAIPGAADRSVAITGIRTVDRGVLLRLEGVDTREDAQALTGATIGVAAERLTPLGADDEFYVRDLIGCAVLSGAAPLGEVVEVYAGSANDALVVTREGGDQVLVPFTKDAVTELDLAGRRVVIRADLFGTHED